MWSVDVRLHTPDVMLQIYEVINNLNMVDEDELTEEVIEPEAARRGSQIELSKLMVRTSHPMLQLFRQCRTSRLIHTETYLNTYIES